MSTLRGAPKARRAATPTSPERPDPSCLARESDVTQPPSRPVDTAHMSLLRVGWRRRILSPIPVAEAIARQLREVAELVDAAAELAADDRWTGLADRMRQAARLIQGS